MKNNSNRNVVCFGEILGYILASETMPGGAPVNVACHLKKSGKETVLITRVGVDAFSAGMLSKLLDNAPPKGALDYAGRMGAFMATQRGACPEYDLRNVENLMEGQSQNMDSYIRQIKTGFYAKDDLLIYFSD